MQCWAVPQFCYGDHGGRIANPPALVPVTRRREDSCFRVVATRG